LLKSASNVDAAANEDVGNTPTNSRNDNSIAPSFFINFLLFLRFLQDYIGRVINLQYILILYIP
jgi:hypothetical protein